MLSTLTKKRLYILATLLMGFAGVQTKAQINTNIPATTVQPLSAADTSKPGFIWRIHQSASGQPTTLVRAEGQLAGLFGGDNIADPNSPGVASGVAAPANPSTAPIEFIIPDVINLNQNDGGANGNFTPDGLMPGVTGTLDNFAVEVLTWLHFPKGDVTMGVNSDDGFRVYIGGANPSDSFANTVGEFDGGRGSADTIFHFNIPQDGLYAARLVYMEGGGDANVEWFTQKADGTDVLINDTANGGIAAYRAVTVATPAVLTKVSPAVNQTGVGPNQPINIELTEGGTVIDLATVKLTVDNSPIAVTPTKNGKIIGLKYTPTALYPQNSVHNITVNYTEGTTALSRSWSFTVANYGILTPDMKVTPDTSKPGFGWNVFVNVDSANEVNSTQRTEDALLGILKDVDGNLLQNVADPAAKGAAIAASTAPNPANAPVHFDIAGVINLTQNAADDTDNKNGNFTPDLQMPGVPGTDGSADGIAVEILTYLDLPAGVVTMGVNSDDGFRVSTGNPPDAIGSITLGEFNNLDGRGASDTIFSIFVQEAGVYAFRTTYEEGTGGANIEWFTVKPDGAKVLVNDTANGGIKAYRSVVGGTHPTVVGVTPPAVPRQVNQPSSSLTVIIGDGDNTVDASSVTLKFDGKAVTPNTARQGKRVSVTYAPSGLLIPDQEHSAELSYKDSTGLAVTRQWKFRNLRQIILPAPAVTENFDSYAEGTVPTGWTAINFTSTDTAGEDLDYLPSDTYKGWVVVSRDRLQGLKPRIFPTDDALVPQTVNGQTVTTDTLSTGNLLYAESDSRGGDQVQFIVSKPFDLSKLTNVVLSFASLYEQNQDNVDAVEYSVDGAKTWLPVVIYLDIADTGGDIKLNPDGSVDALTTLNSVNADTAAWTDNGVAKGDKYADGLLTPITASLSNYIAPRINDNPNIDKRIEIFSLPQAGGKSDVRLRFSQLGTGSWYFGVDNIGFYEGPVGTVVTPPTGGKLDVPTIQGGQIKISWTGTGTLETAISVNGPWAAAASQTNPQTVSPTGGTMFFRLH